MTGPEHYETAAALVGVAEQQDDEFTVEGRANVIALGQLHATLAVAAATALTGAAAFEAAPQSARREVEAWIDVAGTPVQRGTEPAPGHPAT